MKYLLNFEFRYMSVPVSDHFSGHTNKTVTIGIFDSLADAVKAGNECLTELAKTFDVRDKFSLSGLFGMPTKLVTNTCTRDKIHFFGTITVLDFSPLSDLVAETFEARKQYEIHIKNHK